jgi:Fe-S-cluster containining protein
MTEQQFIQKIIDLGFETMHLTPGSKQVLEMLVTNAVELKNEEAKKEVIELLTVLRDTIDQMKIDVVSKTDLVEKADSMFQILLILNQLVFQDIKRSPHKDDIICRKGCSFCCKQNVDISEEEGYLLLTYARQKGIYIDRQYLKKQNAVKDKMAIAFDPTVNSCVFLDKDKGECKVYTVRPASCRNFYSVDDSADRCDTVKYPKGQIKAPLLEKAEMFTAAMKNALTSTERGSMSDTLLKILPVFDMYVQKNGPPDTDLTDEENLTF